MTKFEREMLKLEKQKVQYERQKVFWLRQRFDWEIENTEIQEKIYHSLEKICLVLKSK